MAITKRVILAAGHGGGDNGAAAQGTTEAKETIDITNRVVAILKKDKQLSVVQVPNSLNLQASINWVNTRYKSVNNGLAVEIHKNAGGGDGSEVWYPSNGDKTSRTMASKIAAALKTATKQPNRGIKDAKTNRHGKLGWTDDTNTYALLVEAGFIDRNPVGSKANAKYAEGIANGLLAVWGLRLKTVKKPTPKKPEVLKWVKMERPRKMVVKSDTYVYDVKTGNKVGSKLKKGTEVSFTTKDTYKGVLWLRSAYSTSKKLNWGVDVKKLSEVPKPAPKPTPKPTPAPIPVITKDDQKAIDKAQNDRLSAIEKLLKNISDFLANLFNGYKKG